MAAPSTPTNFWVQTANSQNYISWDLMATATSYKVQRSTDGVSYATVATPSTPYYLDTSVSNGNQYYYQVAATNGSGDSAYTTPQAIVTTPSGEMCLGAIRLAAQQRADRVGSNFVTLPEWNSYINQSMYELYDLIVTSYEDQIIASPIYFNTDGSTFLYPLPDGASTFYDINNNPVIAPPFYKLRGVDLGVNNANNAWVTLNKFSFIDRNRFVYPNSNSTIYGVFNLQYRMMGSNIELIPTPAANQKVRLWYIPKLAQLLTDRDITSISISGWVEYVIVDAAIKALQKEESDISALMAQKMALKSRIEESAVNRDVGQPDKIGDVRGGSIGSEGGWGGNNGPIGGW